MTVLTPRQILDHLVSFPTVSRCSNLALVDWLEGYLTGQGVKCFRHWNEDRQKAALIGHAGPWVEGAVVLSGHSDVVPVDGQAWASDPWVVEEREGRLYGRGTCDMKGYVALAVWALVEAQRRGVARPLQLALSYDEELGCTGVTSLVDRLASMPVKPALCVVGEPTSMQVIVGHKGGGMFRVVVTGTSAHSSLAPTAVNAIEYAAEMIAFIKGLSAEQAHHGAHDHLYDVAHSTLSVTTISGGAALNIIPNHCEFGFDIRSLPEVDARALVERIRDHARTVLLPRMRAIAPEADIRVEPIVEFVGLSTDVEHPAVTFVKQLVGRNDHAKVAYGTEAGLFSVRAGIVSVVCGPGAIAQAHKPDEFIALSEVERCRIMIDRLADILETSGLNW